MGGVSKDPKDGAHFVTLRQEKVKSALNKALRTTPVEILLSRLCLYWLL